MPSAIDGLGGVTAIETSTAGVTVKIVLPPIDPDVAVMLVVPAPTEVASPWLLVELLIFAVDGVSELHCTVEVRFCVPPSVNVPVAVNCCVVPSGMEGIAGVTEIETSVAGVTVRVVEPAITPRVAVTLVLPAETADATPTLFTVATAEFAVVQEAELVTSCVLPSVNVPVAFRTCVVPLANDGFAGVTAIDTSVAAATVRLVEPVIEPDVAVIEVTPAVTPVASPVLPMVALPCAEELQLTELVRFWVLPSV